MKKISNFKKIDLEDIERIYKIEEYPELVNLVKKLILDKKIEIIKASGINGKRPALFKKYRVIKKEEDFNIYLDELNYKINPKLDTSYYRNNIKKYIEDRNYIKKLSDFLYFDEDKLKVRISEKERSFEIWQEEKYLRRKGIALLKKLSYSFENLNYYDTNEPLAYYSNNKEVPQNILIIENKDTFYTIRKFLMNNSNIFGVDIGTVIYGKGKGISRSILDLKLITEEHIASKGNEFLYLGDLDYEGIIIYELLEKEIKKEYKIEPFLEGYIKMLEKGESLIDLPKSKENQNKNLKGCFLEFFDLSDRVRIDELLKSGKYIPQEIINIGDLQK